MATQTRDCSLSHTQLATVTNCFGIWKAKDKETAAKKGKIRQNKSWHCLDSMSEHLGSNDFTVSVDKHFDACKHQLCYVLSGAYERHEVAGRSV